MIDLAQFEGHSPAPWRCSNAAIDRNPHHQTRAICTASEVIADFWETGTDAGMAREDQRRQRDANAKLAAAAPDLLAELRQARADNARLRTALASVVADCRRCDGKGSAPYENASHYNDPIYIDCPDCATARAALAASEGGA